MSYINNEDLVKDNHAYETEKEFQAYTNGRQQDYNYTTTMTMLPFKPNYIKIPLQTYSHFLQWRADPVSPLTQTLTPQSTRTLTMTPTSSSNNAAGDYIIMTLLTF